MHELILEAGARARTDPLPNGTRVVDTTSLPMFAAVGWDGDGADRLRDLVRRSDALTLRGTAVRGGAPGILANGLALLGGPDYGRSERGDVLAGRYVVIDLEGAPADVFRGVAHLERMARALGADDIRCATDRGGTQDSWAVVGTSAGAAPAVDAALGQVVLPEHPELEEALARSVRAAARYCPPDGHPRLREALFSGLGAQAAGPARTLTVTAGASMALTSALSALVPRGGAVLVPDPGYPPYRALVRKLGLRALPYPAPRPGERLSSRALAKAAEAHAVLWNSPSNPTGWVATPEDVELLVASARKHDLLVISDQVYAGLEWGGVAGRAVPQATEIADRTVVVDSASKRYAAAGVRVGWVHGPTELVDAVTSAHWSFCMSPPSHSQLAVVDLLERSDVILDRVRSQLSEVLERLPPPVPRPEAGPYLWLRAGSSGTSAAKNLEIEGPLRVMPGEVFGERGTGRVRINLGALAAEGEGAERALHRALGVLDTARGTGTR
ncbi:pyridoxal phosphate-dependent aminotransferase [Nocardiopsis salina]|uniref:pyridoxal phosphate-dependent aminotransferase n=1 Tax=Nocardiopsis salina TaxID=245836 RepID=UPI00037E8CCD|nr:pyridoxal phosphate-dependent aminotransferase [Nocardiopsis salina]